MTHHVWSTETLEGVVVVCVLLGLLGIYLQLDCPDCLVLVAVFVVASHDDVW